MSNVSAKINNPLHRDRGAGDKGGMKMPDKDEALEEELPKKEKKSSKMLVSILIIVSLVLIGAVVFFSSKGKNKSNNDMSMLQSSLSGVSEPVEIYPPKKDPALSFQVNLADEAERHMVIFKMRIGYGELNAKRNKKTLMRLSERDFQIRDLVNRILMDKKSEDLRGREKINELSAKILNDIKGLFEQKYRKEIKSILIEQILVQ